MPLTVAVTGPTGTFGSGLVPLLEADERIGQIVGLARRSFDPSARGWSKMRYVQGDVRDPTSLVAGFDGADVVVHLAFLITGSAKDPAMREINIDGTRNAFEAAVAAGAKRFVYASSVSVYGYDPGRSGEITEEAPTVAARHFRYAQQKAELEDVLAALAARHPEIDLYVLRTPGVTGPDMIGGKSKIADRVVLPLFVGLLALLRRLPVRLPVPMPSFEVQTVHQSDVGAALVQCIVAAGPAGAYNIACEGAVTSEDFVRMLGLRPLPMGGRSFRRLMGWLASLSGSRFGPDRLGMLEMFSGPQIVDTGKARALLGWTPQWSGVAALAETFGLSLVEVEQ